MTTYMTVLSATPEPGDSGTHIALVCTWEDGLGEELVRVDTGVAYDTDGYDAATAKEAAEDKLGELGWSVGSWSESGGDWYAESTKDDDDEDNTDFDAEHGYTAAVGTASDVVAGEFTDVAVGENDTEGNMTSTLVLDPVETPALIGADMEEIETAAEQVLAVHGWERTGPWEIADNALYAPVQRA